MFTNLEIYERAWRKQGVKLPTKQPIENLTDLILLTEENRKQYVKLGNSLFTIREHHKGQYYDIVGVFAVLPPLKKGYWYFKDYPLHKDIMAVMVQEDENKDDWETGYRGVIDWGIKQGNMYFIPGYPITKWKHSKSRLAK